MYFPSAATYTTIPSDVLQALVLTHRMFDYYIVHCIVAQVQLEAQNHQHRPWPQIRKKRCCERHTFALCMPCFYTRKKIGGTTIKVIACAHLINFNHTKLITVAVDPIYIQDGWTSLEPYPD